MADVESLVADFVTDISEVVKAYWGPLAGEAGYSSGHIIIGVLEQVKQKILEEMGEELFKAVLKEQPEVAGSQDDEQMYGKGGGFAPE